MSHLQILTQIQEQKYDQTEYKNEDEIQIVR